MLNKWCVFSHIFQESVNVSTENTPENVGDKTQEASQVKRLISVLIFFVKAPLTPDIWSCVIFFLTVSKHLPHLTYYPVFPGGGLPYGMGGDARRLA